MSGKFVGNVNITRDVELRYVGDKNTAVSDLGVVCVNGFGNNEKKAYFDVTVWGKNAENCEKYLNKGDTIFIEAVPNTESWESNGEKRSKLKFVAEHIDFVRTRKNSSTTQQSNENDNSDSSSSNSSSNNEVPF